VRDDGGATPGEVVIRGLDTRIHHASWEQIIESADRTGGRDLGFQGGGMTKTIILGDEFDDHLRSVLAEVMRDMGAKTLVADWSVVGSQEFETAKLELRGKIVDVESETYVGLSITGDENDVDEIAHRVSEKQK
jgi:hypothetical protein